MDIDNLFGLSKVNMQAQKKYTNNSIRIISVNPEIYRYNSISTYDFNLMVQELLHSLSVLNSSNNSLIEYYKKSGLHIYDSMLFDNGIENAKERLTNAQIELKNNKPISEKVIITSYFLKYKYLNEFQDVWYDCPHKSLSLSDDYLEFFEKIPGIKGKDFFVDSTVLTDFFNGNIQFSLEEAFLGGMAVDLDMYLVQLDKKVCAEILKLKTDCPVDLKVENEMFFNYMKTGTTEQTIILVAYF